MFGLEYRSNDEIAFGDTVVIRASAANQTDSTINLLENEALMRVIGETADGKKVFIQIQ